MALMILAASPYFVAFALLRGLDRAAAIRAWPYLAAPFLWVALELARARMPDIGFPGTCSATPRRAIWRWCN